MKNYIIPDKAPSRESGEEQYCGGAVDELAHCLIMLFCINANDKQIMGPSCPSVCPEIRSLQPLSRTEPNLEGLKTQQF